MENSKSNFSSGLVVLVMTLGLLIFWPGLLQNLLVSSGFMPHGHCYLWKSELVSLHLASDILIGLAYISISITLAYLVKKAPNDIPFDWVFLAFGAFIIACGATHFMEVWTLWHPTYWLAGEVKLITAIASVTTAVVLPPLVPQTLTLIRSAKKSSAHKLQLETANEELKSLYEKLKEIDQIKSQFFANISHELRTPLALIIGPIERLLEIDGLNDTQRHKLGIVRNNAITLLKHVNDLLDISKLEAEKMQINYVQADLGSLVRITAGNFHTIAEDSQISLTVETPESLSAQVDTEKLQKVLLNLLANAFKFTPAGGTIRCKLTETKKGELRESEELGSAQESPSHFTITIEDSGTGVPLELREIIFEPFRQGEGGSTRRFGGTGLGLAIAKEFVELHGGTITVSDSPLGGAKFSVQLPLTVASGCQVKTIADDANNGKETKRSLLASLLSFSPEQVTIQLQTELQRDQQSLQNSTLTETAKLSSSAARTTTRNSPLVLVVEDHPEMNQFIAETLATEYSVVNAFNGNEGLEKAIRLRPDLIVSDVMMPQMSGDILVSRIREQPELNSIPIVLLTAKADENLRVKLLRQGVQDYLTKPFKSEELKARVGNLLSMKRTRDVLQQELASQTQDLEILANELANRKQDLEKLASELEIRVQERTAELVASNISLTQEIVAKELSESTLRSFYNSTTMLMGVVELTKDDIQHISDNLSAVQFFGLTRAKMQDRFASNLGLPADILDTWLNSYRKSERTQSPVRFEYQHKTADKNKWLAVTVCPIVLDESQNSKDAAQKPLSNRFSYVAEDITERKQTEEALYRSEQEFRALVENAPDVILRLNREHRYVYVNPVVEQLTDMPRSIFIGKNYRELGYSEESSQLWDKALERVFATGEEQAIEFQSPTVKGIRAYQSRLVPEFGKQGTTEYALVISRDITELKQAEENIRILNAQLEQRVIERTAQLEAANKELEQANRMKDEFLAIVSHELRTPLNAMLGWATLLRTRKFDETMIARALETIERNAKSQSQLIEDLLDVSRMIRGQIRLQLNRVDLFVILEAAISGALPSAQAKSINLQFFEFLNSQSYTAGNFKFLVTGDANRLQQVIWNLISNAIKFTPTGGRVEVRLSVESGESGQGGITNYAQIQVIDTGKGITSEFLPYVFDRFRQGDASSTRAYGGLGLGLAIVRHLVELHGGTVQAASEGESKGSIFTVRLPLIDLGNQGEKLKGQDYTVSPLASQLQPLNNLRILVVDDDAGEREFLSNTLKEYGAEVIAIGLDQSVIEVFSNFTLDVVVSNILMSDIDGYSVIQQIRKWETQAGKRIPAVALSAEFSSNERKLALDAGFQRCISKPVEPAQLVAAIATLTGRIKKL